MIIIVLGVPFLLGLFALSALLGKQAAQYSLWEKLALAFSIGLGLLAILMYALSLAKLPLNLPVIGTAVFIIIALISIYLIASKTFCLSVSEMKSAFIFKDLKFNWFESLLLGLIGLKVIYAFFTALAKPLVDVDAFLYYSIVGKGIYYTGNFFDPYLKQFLSDKPPLPFLMQGWAFIGLGRIDDALFKIITPALFLCLIIIFYSALKRFFLRWFSLLFTFLLATLPFLLYHIGTAYSDFPVTFYYSVGTFYLFLFLKEFDQEKETNGTFLPLALIFLALSIWAKKAGLILTAIDIFILFIFLFNLKNALTKRTLRSLALGLSLLFLLAIPVLVQGGFRTTIGILTSLSSHRPAATAIDTFQPTPGLFERTSTIMFTFSRKLFLYADWHLLWPLFIFSLIFFFRQAFSPPLVYLLIITILGLLSVFVQFESGGTFRWLLDGTLLDRLVMTTAPSSLLFSAYAFGFNRSTSIPDNLKTKPATAKK